MNRFPNLVGAPGAALSARHNGFLRRRIFSTPGSYTQALPAGIPTDERGFVRVMGFVIGAGAGGNDANGGGANASGSGGGFSLNELWVPPGSSFSIVVGAGGAPKIIAITDRSGGTSSITIDGVTWQATGGQNTAGGVGSGGVINTSGGAQVTYGSNDVSISGCAAGSPWGNGAQGKVGPNAAGAKWQMPTFWDLEDIAAASPFLTIDAVGAGSSAKSAAGVGTFAAVATYGGGGGGGFGSASAGADGLAMIYW